MKLLGYFRHIFIWVFKPLIIYIGRAHFPGSKRKMVQKDVFKCLEVAKPGDILLSRKDWEPTNLMIKGKYKHAGMVTGPYLLVEAVAPIAKETGFFDFIMKSDKVVLCRPRGFTQDELDKAVDYAKSIIGSSYDYYFVEGNEDHYCSELCYEALKHCKPGWTFTRRLIFGKKTVLPDDIRLATNHFDIVWASKGN